MYKKYIKIKQKNEKTLKTTSSMQFCKHREQYNWRNEEKLECIGKEKGGTPRKERKVELL